MKITYLKNVILFSLIAVGIFFILKPAESRAANSFTKDIKITSRGGVSDPTSLNPFSVLNGDELLVTIKTKFNDINHSGNRATITDNVLKLKPTGQRGWCEYVAGSAVVPSNGALVSADAVSVVFSYVVDNTHYDGEFSYKCRINIKSDLDDKGVDSAYALPEIMVGQLTVEQIWDGLNSSKVYYAGMPTNEVVANYSSTYDLLAFSTPLAGCFTYWPSFPATGYCYNLTPSLTMRNMVSQTSAEDTKVLEISTLLYEDYMMMGDAYSNPIINNYLDKFTFLGRNLNESASSTIPGKNATWNTTNYLINPSSQSYYKYDASRQSYYDQRIAQLKSEAQVITNTNLNTRDWYLQGDGIGTFIDQDQANSKYPEGKVWVVNSDVSITRDIRYHGVGTIIIMGKLGFDADHQFLPASSADNIGLIVVDSLHPTGTVGVTFRQGANQDGGQNRVSNFKFHGVIFSYKAFDFMGAGINLVGSFVASGFNIRYSGVRFYYDYRLDSGWPPGFRYFNMPTPKSSSP